MKNSRSKFVFIQIDLKWVAWCVWIGDLSERTKPDENRRIILTDAADAEA